MRNLLIDRLCEDAKVNKDLVVVVGDLGYGCFEKFSTQFPDRFYNCGIAEQSMMGIAAGLAKEGKKVFIYSIGNFPSLRCIEQLRNNVCYPKLDVNVISIGSGLEYGQLGCSHHATEDYSVVSALPNISVYVPANRSQFDLCLNEILNNKLPAYIKLNKSGIDKIYTDCEDIEIDKIKNGKDVAIFATGTIVDEALKYYEKDNSVSIYSICKVKPLNEEKILKIISDYRELVTIEEHNRKGGFGETIATLIATHNLKTKIKIISMKDEFPEIVGDRQYLRNILEINSDKIEKILNKNK